MENKNNSNNEEVIVEKKINTSALQNPWFYVSVIAVIVIIAMGYNLMKLSGTEKVVGDNEAQQQSPTQQSIIEVSIDDDSILGDPNAPVTIIEFSDYECPFCSRFYVNTLPQLKSEYIDTGKVKLIYRDFPLSFHQNAQKAAEATETARELGGDEAFWKMHDKIFENQQSISEQDLIKYAGEIGLNEDKFKEILNSGKYGDEVQKDFQDGQKAGVQGTPTFFINGKPLVGAQPFEAFKQVIEGEL